MRVAPGLASDGLFTVAAMSSIGLVNVRLPAPSAWHPICAHPPTPDEAADEKYLAHRSSSVDFGRVPHEAFPPSPRPGMNPPSVPGSEDPPPSSGRTRANGCVVQVATNGSRTTKAEGENRIDQPIYEGGRSKVDRRATTFRR